MDATRLYPEEKNSLEFLGSADPLLTHEFCQLLKTFLAKGEAISPKMYLSAAKKLNIQPSEVSASLNGLLSILQRSANSLAPATTLQHLLAAAEFPEAGVAAVMQLYEDVAPQLLFCSKQPIQVPALKSLEWRIDVVAATRSVQGLAEPLLTLHVNTEHLPASQASVLGLTPLCPPTSSVASSVLVLQTDAPTARRVCSVLETAVAHARAPHHARLATALS